MMTEKKAALHRLEDYSLDQMSALLSRTGDDLSPYMAQVAPVIEQVREGGDAALAALAADLVHGHPQIVVDGHAGK